MRKYYKRQFLNKGPGAAAIEVDDDGNGYGRVKLTDCNRAINLETHSSGKKEKDNTLHKLDVLIKTLSDYRAKLGASE